MPRANGFRRPLQSGGGGEGGGGDGDAEVKINGVDAQRWDAQRW